MNKLSELSTLDLVSLMRREALSTVYTHSSEELTAAVKELKARGFKATLYAEVRLMHVYDEHVVEVQRWRGKVLQSVGACTGRELMSHVYFYILDRMIATDASGDRRLYDYYAASIAKLASIWKPRRMSYESRELWFS